MARYKVTFCEQVREYVPPKGQMEGGDYIQSWQVNAELMGDEKVIAGALRAMADQIDPPKSVTR